MTIDSSSDERDGSKGGRKDSRRRGRRDHARDGDVEIVSHNREDEFAKMLESDSDADDDEAKVSEFAELQFLRCVY